MEIWIQNGLITIRIHTQSPVSVVHAVFKIPSFLTFPEFRQLIKLNDSLLPRLFGIDIYSNWQPFLHRAMSVSCLPRIHACTIKSKQTKSRQVIYCFWHNRLGCGQAKSFSQCSTDSLFCRAINVSCLPRIQAYAIKSKQTKPRQVIYTSMPILHSTKLLSMRVPNNGT